MVIDGLLWSLEVFSFEGRAVPSRAAHARLSRWQLLEVCAVQLNTAFG